MAAACTSEYLTYFHCAGDFVERWALPLHTVLTAEPLSLLLALTVLVVRFGGVFFARSPLRRVRLRMLPVWWWGDTARKTPLGARRRVWRMLRRALVQVQNGESPPPAVAARRLREPRVRYRPGAATDWPFEHSPGEGWTAFEFAHDVVGRALEPRSSTLVARYLLADRWSANRAFLVELFAYLDQFVGLYPTLAPGKRPASSPGDLSFGASVSAMTGAVVLADATTSNAGCVEQFAVWHDGAWVGKRHDDLTRTFDTAYAVATRPRRGVVPLQMPGRYNGRIPVLRQVEVRQHPGSDGATLVFVTDETDYDTTEGGPTAAGKDAAFTTTLQCKKLGPARSDSYMARFRLAGSADEPYAGAHVVSGDRATMVNGKVALLSMSTQGTFLALMQRSARVSNGRQVLSLSSGGVIELGVRGDARDGDRFGGVDFLHGIRREIHEELGLDPDDYVLEANCVFAANNRPRPRGDNVDNGELVATVLATGRTPLTRDEFRARLYRASPSKGRYESTGLVFVPLGGRAEDFAATIWRGTYDTTSLAWNDALLPSPDAPPPPGSSRVLHELEQSGLVGALYAAAAVFGPGPTAAAFRSVMGQDPWWTQPWPVDPADPVGDDVSLARVCRPPRSLLEHGETFDDWVSITFGGGSHDDFDPTAVR